MSGSLVSCDSSVLISALRPTRAGHEASLEAVGRVNAIAVHALLEVFSVLTRLPGGDRVPAELLARELARLEWKQLQLPAEEYLPLLLQFAEAGHSGGAIYDAQIAATAKHHGARLLTRDRRAEKVYAMIGVDVEFVDGIGRA